MWTVNYFSLKLLPLTKGKESKSYTKNYLQESRWLWNGKVNSVSLNEEAYKYVTSMDKEPLSLQSHTSFSRTLNLIGASHYRYSYSTRNCHFFSFRSFLSLSSYHIFILFYSRLSFAFLPIVSTLPRSLFLGLYFMGFFSHFY